VQSFSITPAVNWLPVTTVKTLASKIVEHWQSATGSELLLFAFSVVQLDKKIAKIIINFFIMY
jgi:hypothetical protein